MARTKHARPQRLRVCCYGWARLSKGRIVVEGCHTVNGYEQTLAVYATKQHAERAACYGETVERVRLSKES